MPDSDDDQTGVPLFEGFSDSTSPPPSAKRKRDAESKPDGKKSAKRRRLRKPKDVDDEALDVELGVNHAISYMDRGLLADHMAQRTKKFRPDMSLVEAEEYYIPGTEPDEGSDSGSWLINICRESHS